MIHRIDVRLAPNSRSADAGDPLGQSIRHQIIALGHAALTNPPAISTSRIFLIDSDATTDQIRRVADELLADPIVEDAIVVTDASTDASHSRIEIHLKPGVMDPVAASTEMAMRDMGIAAREVRTGRAFIFSGNVDQSNLKQIATRLLANGVIETVHFSPFIPDHFAAGHQQPFGLRHVNIRQLDDAALQKLSREGHLFLSLAEMRAIQSYFKEQNREPTDIELETLAQTWSEHCVHKTLKSAVEVVDENGKPLRKYSNLIKETIFRATEELMNRGSGVGVQGSGEVPNASDPKPDTRNPKPDFCLSVFKDNAGVIAFDETHAVCFKVETHNHPSAIEPYGGAATGAGGVIRDILGTGLAAKPIANTDVFCVAYPDRVSGFGSRVSGEMQNPNPTPDTRNPKPDALPKGVIHPKRVLEQVVAGVRDYGNRMGIPTVNGAVYFDDRYLGNPLVFCGCVGLIPRDKIQKDAKPGDAIVLMGGRTGRDGIHGATFSSAELTDTHADEFSHAVQIGNAITEKKLADVILVARDLNLFTAITDLGAGGLSSAVGEMGEKLGARVELHKVPLKYAGLRYDEIWISEAQERMLLSVPANQIDALLKLSADENVEATVIGEFGTKDHELILNYRETEVGRIAMRFMHEGLPMPTRKARVSARSTGFQPVPSRDEGRHGLETRATNLRGQLLSLLAHPNIASKHWIIRQYDHEVQGGSVIKPLIGPQQIGPSDAAVIRPKLNSTKGVVLACGMSPRITDPYAMAIASIDEAIRNAVAIGADPTKLAILDNFCWPSVDDEHMMGTLVAACEACYDAAKAYGIPFISGKDSLHNQFTNQETKEVLKIPNTLLISAIGVIDDVRKCVTMDLKRPGSDLMLVTPGRNRDLSTLARIHRRIADCIAAGEVLSCHDVSDGGMITAAAEMCIASGLGVQIKFPQTIDDWFTETENASYLLEVPSGISIWKRIDPIAEVRHIGNVIEEPNFHIKSVNLADEIVSVQEMTNAWRGTLDW